MLKPKFQWKSEFKMYWPMNYTAWLVFAPIVTLAIASAAYAPSDVPFWTTVFVVAVLLYYVVGRSFSK